MITVGFKSFKQLLIIIIIKTSKLFYIITNQPTLITLNYDIVQRMARQEEDPNY